MIDLKTHLIVERIRGIQQLFDPVIEVFITGGCAKDDMILGIVIKELSGRLFAQSANNRSVVLSNEGLDAIFGEILRLETDHCGPILLVVLIAMFNKQTGLLEIEDFGCHVDVAGVIEGDVGIGLGESAIDLGLILIGDECTHNSLSVLEETFIVRPFHENLNRIVAFIQRFLVFHHSLDHMCNLLCVVGQLANLMNRAIVMNKPSLQK